MPNTFAPDVSQEQTAEYSLILSPKSHLYLEQTSQGADMSPWDPAIARRLISAFEKGSGHGLFWLGAREVDSVLPPVFAKWRDFTRVFMHRVCTLSDREGNNERPEIPFPVEEAKGWLASAPLMTGAEYLSEEALRGLWSEMTSAYHREKGGFAGSLQQFLQRLHPVWNQVGRVYLHLAENKQGQEAPFAFLATF